MAAMTSRILRISKASTSSSYMIHFSRHLLMKTCLFRFKVTVSPFQESRITTVMPFADELWVGLGNGQVLIFDLIENETPSKEENLDKISDSCDQTGKTCLNLILCQ